MLSYVFLHADQIVPAPEFISAFNKLARASIADMFMKLRAVLCEALILGGRIRNAGDLVEYILFGK